MTTTDGSLNGRSVLIVEDEYLLAAEMAQELVDRGARVIGPIGRLDVAVDHIGRAERVDVAILDINLRGEMSFGLADTLSAQGVPIVFATGYSDMVLPERFRDTPRCEKPIRAEALCAAIAALITPAEPT